MSTRRQAREMALQMLYQSDVGGAEGEQVLAEFRPTEYSAEAERAFGYARSLVEGTLGHRQEIDDLIRQQAEHWRLERMPPVDRNILRLAVYEFLYQTDVPKLVILDEAIELAKEFGSEQSGRFVNGLLDGILKRHSFPGTLT